MVSSPADVFAGNKFLDCVQKGFSAKIQVEYPECLFGILEELPTFKELRMPPIANKLMFVASKGEIDASINLTFK